VLNGTALNTRNSASHFVAAVVINAVLFFFLCCRPLTSQDTKAVSTTAKSPAQFWLRRRIKHSLLSPFSINYIASSCLRSLQAIHCSFKRVVRTEGMVIATKVVCGIFRQGLLIIYWTQLLSLVFQVFIQQLIPICLAFFPPFKASVETNSCKKKIKKI
jgi:hypothetical protein